MEKPPSRMLESLQAIYVAAGRLREALMARRSDEILAIANEQEQFAENLKALLAAGPGRSADPASAADPGERQAVRELAEAIKRTHRTNHSLASALCETIDRTLLRFCTGEGAGARTYGADGTLTSRVSPVLVYQKG